MVWNFLIPAAASLIGGAVSSGAQRDAANQQAQGLRESNQTQVEIADRQIDFTREMMDRQMGLDREARLRSAAALYPRQQASNAALQKVTDLYGLGDIYAAPEHGNLGGAGAFYPENPFDTQLVNSLSTMSPDEVQAYRDNALGQYSDMPGSTYFDRVTPRTAPPPSNLPQNYLAPQGGAARPLRAGYQHMQIR